MNWFDDPKFKRDIGADRAADVTMTGHNQRYCVECKHKPVEGKALCCSAKCRKHRQRRRQMARLAMPLALSELGKIRDSIKRRERLPDFIADLNRLKAEINDLLLLAGETSAVERNAMIVQRKMRL